MRLFFISSLTFLLAAAVESPSHATTWGAYPENCPICDDPTSLTTAHPFDNLIYKNDPRHDLVESHHPDNYRLFSCSECGFVQLNINIGLPFRFPMLQTEMKDFLRSNYTPVDDEPPTQTLARLRALIDLQLKGGYGYGWQTDEFWQNQNMIFIYREIDPQIAKSLAARQIELIEQEAIPKEIDDLDLIYLLGEYNRMTGNRTEARKFLKQTIAQDYISYFMPGLILNLVLLVVDTIVILGLIFFILRYRILVRKNHVIILVVAIFIWLGSFLIHERMMSYANSFEYYYRPKYASLARDRLGIMIWQK